MNLEKALASSKELEKLCKWKTLGNGIEVRFDIELTKKYQIKSGGHNIYLSTAQGKALYLEMARVFGNE